MVERPAAPSANGAATGSASSDYLIIRLGEEQYALPSHNVREIIRWRVPTPVPGAPSVLPGIISQRGVIITVVDLRVAVGLPAATPERSTRLVIAHYESSELALLVDAVLDLTELAAAALSQPPVGLAPSRARLLTAVVRFNDQPLGVMNLAALIAALQEGVA